MKRSPKSEHNLHKLRGSIQRPNYTLSENALNAALRLHEEKHALEMLINANKISDVVAEMIDNPDVIDHALEYTLKKEKITLFQQLLDTDVFRTYSPAFFKAVDKSALEMSIKELLKQSMTAKQQLDDLTDAMQHSQVGATFNLF